MKVKNMVRNRQSTYSKLVQFSSKNLKSSFLVSLVALILAFIASIVSNSILVCLLSIISLVISGAETVFKLIKGTKDAKVDTLLIVAAVLICFCLGNFNVAASAMALYKFLSTVIAYVLGILGKDLKAIVEVSPKYANEIDYNSDIRVIPSENIVKGTKIMVKVGEVVPVDCIITEGFSEFDTSRVYESDEQSFSSGDKLLAGFINTGSSVTCVALCDYDESLVKDLNRLSDMAEVTSTIGEKRFLKIAKWYPLLVLVLAIAVLIIGGILSGSWAGSMKIVSILLVAATTGSFIVAVPLFSSCAVWKLKKKGIAISACELLDEIADINCVAFEKNGILTDGIFEISDTYMAEGITESDLLMIAGICVGGRTHPVSRLFTQYMNEHLVAENVMEFPGKGVECTIMGKSFICGTEGFIKECGVDISEIPGFRLYITIDKVLMGAVSYEDSLFQNSTADVAELRKTGVEKIVMFTPDKDENAKAAFEASGADEYIADLTPFGRAEAVSKLKQEENVTCAYIGENLGGEQAISEADIGISLINREESGLEFSKVVLLGKLKALAEAIEISRLANGKLEIHFYCASAVKIIITLLGLFGAINVAATIVLDSLLTIAALLSAKELLRK